MREFGLVIAAAMLANVCAAPASALDIQNHVAQQGTPEALVSALMAAKGGSEADLVSLLADESRLALGAHSSGSAAMTDVQHAFRQALDDRFGRGTPMNESLHTYSSTSRDVLAVLKPIESMQLVGVTPGANGRIVLHVKVVRPTSSLKSGALDGSLIAEREGGIWRLVLPDAADNQSAATRAAAIQQMTAKIRAGAYPNRQAAMIAMSKASAEETGK